MQPQQRPRWLEIALACLAGWLTFLFSSFLYAMAAFAGIQAIFRGKGLSGPPAVLALVVVLLGAATTAFATARWQHRILARRSPRTSYIILVILTILTLSFVPAPYYYSAP
jgi:hypothetical protein